MRLRLCSSICALTLLVSLSGPVRAADPEMSEAIALCDGKFGLCRYINKRTKEEILPARFEHGMPFSEGVAAVRINGRYGYIDHRGDIVIEPRFDLAGDFYQGLAEILVGNKTGVINRKGDIVIPPMFKRAIPFTKDVVIAEEGTWASGYYEGFEKLPGLKDGAFHLSKSGLYHVGGYWIRKPDLKQIRRFDLEGRGLIWASIPDERSGVFGLLASDGSWVVEPQYEYAGALSEDRAVVRKRVDNILLAGAVDPTGKLVVPLEARGLFDWRNGWAVVQQSYQGGKRGLLDKSGNLVGGRYFDKVDSSLEGDIAAVQLDGSWMGLDRAGNIVQHPRNGHVSASCPNGVRVVWLDGKLQITDANGQQTVPYLFEYTYSKPTCDRPFSVRLNDKWGFIGLDGRLLFDPPIFDNQYSFENGFAIVQQGSKWGIIDTSGRFTVTPKFDQLVGGRVGLFQGKLDGREIWITTSGEERPEPPIKYTPSPDMLDCGHGLKLIARGGLWGVADADGKDVIAPRYRALSCFKNGVAWAPIDSQRQWCAVGPDGTLRDKPACKIENYPYFQTHSYPEKFHEDRFENSVLWSRAYLEFGASQRETPPRWVHDGVRPTFSIIR